MNITDCNTILCVNVPKQLLHKNEAKRYFKTFGTIKKIIVKPKSSKCIVEYESADAAGEALALAGEYDGVEFNIEYMTKPPKSKRKPAKDPDPEWELADHMDDESNELIDLTKRTYNLRPEKMAIDVDTPKSKSESRKSTKRGGSGSKQAGKSSVEAELIHILRQRAPTAEDKYKALDARDKLLRLRRKEGRTIDLCRTAATVGTCPDMCSEKERLMREVQHQVALYEQDADRTMNHTKAVKQYSRSSADQEMPLPHELRNDDVLQMTMGYLMHRIMHLCDAQDVNLAEWYHFLWDRTRGIRKDITQQELCSQGSVRLVEQCARFHIHCSARLVAEDPSVFDQKINTENLTKCLQTLKYMYHDLAVKGERCPNEAEFRAYVILLNLNDGNFMWEVQELRDEIQQSVEVKFALAVYSSLDKNNFARFFKLVRTTTYLNACILLRYFTQVRTKALRTIVQCYTPRLPHAQYPIEQLDLMLAFEALTATTDFLEYNGLTISDDGAFVVLNKRDFNMPDLPYALDRAVNVIESKRMQSVGEVVCGAPLPPPLFQMHQPQNSFDADGRLINLHDFNIDIDFVEQSRDEVDRESAQVTLVEVKPTQHVLGQKPEVSSALPLFIQPQHIMEERRRQEEQRQMFADQLREKRRLEEELTARRVLERQREQQQIARQRLLEQEKQQRLREEAHRAEERRMEIERQQNQLEEQRRAIEKAAEARRQREEKQRIVEEQRKQLERQLREERERVQQMEFEVQRERERQHHLESRRRHEAQLERRRMLEIDATVREVVGNLLIAVDANVRRMRLGELRDAILARSVINRWRGKVQSTKRKRKAIDQGPLWTCPSVEDLADEFNVADQQFTMHLMKRYKRGEFSSSSARDLTEVPQIDLKSLTWSSLLGNGVRSRRLQSDIYWKIGIYFTNCDYKEKEVEGEDEEADEIVAKTIDKVIGWGEKRVLLKQLRELHNTVTYCLHQTDFSSDMNGLAIYVERLTEELIDELIVYLNRLGDVEYLPVVFVISTHDKKLEEEIATLARNKLISEYDIIVTEFTRKNIVHALNNSIRFLSMHARPPPALNLNTLRAFLVDTIGVEIWQRVRSYARWHEPYKKCVARPEVAIGLANQALDRLIAIVSEERRLEYPRFPAIFNDFLPNQIPDYLPCDYKYFPAFWKDTAYTNLLVQTLQEIKLPAYEGKWPLVDQLEVEQNLTEYCKGISPDDRIFFNVMARILQSSTADMSWIDVVEVLITECLKSVNFHLPNIYKNATVFNQLFVVYQTDDLQRYMSDSWFYLKNELVERFIDLEEEHSSGFVPHVEHVHVDSLDEIDFDTVMRKLDAGDGKIAECKRAFGDFRSMLNDLENSISIQKQICKRFQSNLQNYLKDDDYVP